MAQQRAEHGKGRALLRCQLQTSVSVDRKIYPLTTTEKEFCRLFLRSQTAQILIQTTTLLTHKTMDTNSLAFEVELESLHHFTFPALVTSGLCLSVVHTFHAYFSLALYLTGPSRQVIISNLLKVLTLNLRCLQKNVSLQIYISLQTDS